MLRDSGIEVLPASVYRWSFLIDAWTVRRAIDKYASQKSVGAIVGWHQEVAFLRGGRGLNISILKDRMRYAMAFLEKHLQPAEGKKVLDAGCGSGIIGVGMAGRGYFVHGWDISEEMIIINKVLKREGIPPDRYQLTFGNLLESDLEAGSFDGIMALGFIQYQTDEKAVMDYLNYLLRPGGVLVMSGPVGVKLTNYFGPGID